MKVGDLVVPLPYNSSWDEQYPMYVSSMRQFTGIVGVIESTYVSNDKGNVDSVTSLGVGFIMENFNPSWLYREEWLRPATEEEIRIYKFISAVRSRGSCD